MKDHKLAKLPLEKVSLVFQQFQLLSTATVPEYVMMPLFTMFFICINLKDAVEALTRVGLAHWLHHLPSKLSGGKLTTCRSRTYACDKGRNNLSRLN